MNNEYRRNTMSRAIPRRSIHSNEIHVWRAFFDLDKFQQANFIKNLSDDEVERAERFYFARDRNRFIVARGILRQLLGFYLGAHPKNISIEYTVYGKPVLATTCDYNPLCFNLSHADAYALYAFTRNRNIGVDIERVHDNIAAWHIAQKFFSPGEIRILENTPEKERNKVFFQYWTRKEAFLKAKGDGISFPMENCDVSLMTGRAWSPVTFVGDNIQSSSWSGRDLFPGQGYVGAIVVEGDDGDVSYRQYAVRAYYTHPLS